MTQSGHSVEMNARSANEKQRAVLLYTARLTVRQSQRLSQSCGRRGWGAQVEGFLGRQLVITAIVDELALFAGEHPQLQPSGVAGKVGIVLPDFAGSLVGNGLHLRYERLDACDPGLDFDVSGQAAQLPTRAWGAFNSVRA